MALFDLAYQKTSALEGGYTNNPNDAGGETNYGITKAVAMQFGYLGDMKLLPKDTAKAIYKKAYWDPLLLDKVDDQDIAFKIFDIGVNCGQGTAGIFVQKALNSLNRGGRRWPDISEDGLVGNGTVYAINMCVSNGFKDVLLSAVRCLQGAYYIDISRKNPANEEFIVGWFRNRVGA